MTLLNAASRGPPNGRHGGTRQPAELSVYSPPVQQVGRSAHGAAGSGLRGSADPPGGAERPGSGTGAGSLGTSPRYERPDRRAQPGANWRTVARLAQSGACGSARPSAPRIFCALRPQRRSTMQAAGVSRRRQKRKGRSWPRLAACPWAGTTRPSLGDAEQHSGGPSTRRRRQIADSGRAIARPLAGVVACRSSGSVSPPGGCHCGVALSVVTSWCLHGPVCRVRRVVAGVADVRHPPARHLIGGSRGGGISGWPACSCGTFSWAAGGP